MTARRFTFSQYMIDDLWEQRRNKSDPIRVRSLSCKGMYWNHTNRGFLSLCSQYFGRFINHCLSTNFLLEFPITVALPSHPTCYGVGSPGAGRPVLRDFGGGVEFLQSYVNIPRFRTISQLTHYDLAQKIMSPYLSQQLINYSEFI